MRVKYLGQDAGVVSIIHYLLRGRSPLYNYGPTNQWNENIRANLIRLVSQPHRYYWISIQLKLSAGLGIVTVPCSSLNVLRYLH